MTGTERAALRLALGVLRASITFGLGALSRPTVAGYAMASAAAVLFLPDGLRLSLGQCAGDDRRRRRARACLYIRAVLRADAGDDGSWWRWDGAGSPKADECWRDGVHIKGRGFWPMEVGGYWRGESPPIRLARPLWLDARPA